MHYREFIGEFVPIGTANTIDGKETIQIKSQELKDAFALFPANPISFDDPASLSLLLEEDTVVSALWPGRKVRVELSPAPSSRA